MADDELTDVLESVFAKKLLDVHTSMPGRVQSYDATKQVADIEPLLKGFIVKEDGSFEDLALPVLANVPVAFAGGGGFRATYPLAAGDGVTVHFCESSIDVWQKLGGLQPGRGRRFHFSDAVCTPGLHDDSKPWSGASTSKATWGADGGPQVMAGGGLIELGGNANDPTTDFIVRGTTYRTGESTFFTALASACTAAATGLAAGALGLTAAGVAAAPIAPGMATAVAGITAAVTALNTVATALTSFNASAASYLSNVVKTK